MIRRTAFILCLVSAAVAAPAGAAPVRIAHGTPFETEAFFIRSGRPGPTVVIVGGMHGDEPAGRRAAQQIRHWPVTKGLMVVIPVANAPGCGRGTRKVAVKEPFDLNRQFPSARSAPIRGDLPRAIWSIVRRAKPAWLLDLHESADYRYRATATRKAYGHSLIVWPDEADTVAKKMIASADTGTRAGKYAWRLLHRPIEGSLARAAATRLGSHVAIVESCRKEYLAVRVRHHRLVAHRLLTELGMLPPGFSPDTCFAEDRKRGEIRVALYNSTGTGGASAYAVEKCLPPLEGVAYRRVTATEIKGGALRQFDVVVFPGGTGSGTAGALGVDGRKAVRDFVRGGGGYLGICAGAYLATRYYRWSLGVLDANVVDSRHWARGRGAVRMELTQPGRALFESRQAVVPVWYAQGPILAPGSDPKIPDFEPLAVFRTEVAKNGAPRGVMVNTPAIVRGEFGEGRVVAMSPHPEKTKGLYGFIPAAVRWLAGKD